MQEKMIVSGIWSGVDVFMWISSKLQVVKTDASISRFLPFDWTHVHDYKDHKNPDRSDLYSGT